MSDIQKPTCCTKKRKHHVHSNNALSQFERLPVFTLSLVAGFMNNPQALVTVSKYARKCEWHQQHLTAIATLFHKQLHHNLNSLIPALKLAIHRTKRERNGKTCAGDPNIEHDVKTLVKTLCRNTRNCQKNQNLFLAKNNVSNKHRIWWFTTPGKVPNHPKLQDIHMENPLCDYEFGDFELSKILHQWAGSLYCFAGHPFERSELLSNLVCNLCESANFTTGEPFLPLMNQLIMFFEQIIERYGDRYLDKTATDVSEIQTLITSLYKSQGLMRAHEHT